MTLFCTACIVIPGVCSRVVGQDNKTDVAAGLCELGSGTQLGYVSWEVEPSGAM